MNYCFLIQAMKPCYNYIKKFITYIAHLYRPIWK